MTLPPDPDDESLERWLELERRYPEAGYITAMRESRIAGTPVEAIMAEFRLTLVEDKIANGPFEAEVMTDASFDLIIQAVIDRLVHKRVGGRTIGGSHSEFEQDAHLKAIVEEWKHNAEVDGDNVIVEKLRASLDRAIDRALELSPARRGSDMGPAI